MAFQAWSTTMNNIDKAEEMEGPTQSCGIFVIEGLEEEKKEWLERETSKKSEEN